MRARGLWRPGPSRRANEGPAAGPRRLVSLELQAGSAAHAHLRCNLGKPPGTRRPRAYAGGGSRPAVGVAADRGRSRTQRPGLLPLLPPSERPPPRPRRPPWPPLLPLGPLPPILSTAEAAVTVTYGLRRPPGGAGRCYRSLCRPCCRGLLLEVGQTRQSGDYLIVPRLDRVSSGRWNSPTSCSARQRL